MIDRSEQFERESRANRLVEARIRANMGGNRKVSSKFGWNHNTYKAHEKGQNGFGVADAKKYAKAFGVSLNWLYFGQGSIDDPDTTPPSVTDVPLISLVSAGQLLEQDGMDDFSDCRRIPAIDLPDGDWIALKVEGPSMNKISPPDSIIFVNRRDKRLIHNACYVIADESGAATYKRFRTDQHPQFQPASYDETILPPKLEGTIRVIGRVRRTMLEL